MTEVLAFVAAHPWLSFIFGVGFFVLSLFAMLCADAMWTNALNTYLKVTHLRREYEHKRHQSRLDFEEKFYRSPAPATTPKPEDKKA